MSKKLPYTSAEIDWVLRDLVQFEGDESLPEDVQLHLRQSHHCQTLRRIIADEIALSARTRSLGGDGAVAASHECAHALLAGMANTEEAVELASRHGSHGRVGRRVWAALAMAATLLIAVVMGFPRHSAETRVSLADAVSKDLARGAYHLAAERMADSAGMTLTPAEQLRLDALRREQRLMALLDANQPAAVEALYRETKTPNGRETRLFRLAQAGQTTLHPIPALQPTDPAMKGPLDNPRGAELIALLKESDDRWAQYNLGIQYLENEFYTSARKVFDALLEADPHCAEALLARGVVAYRLGEREQARRDFGRALKLRPYDPVLQDYLAQLAPKTPQ